METDLQIRGKVAQFGRGAMEQVAGRMLERFARQRREGDPGRDAARTRGRDGRGAARSRASRGGVWWALAGGAVGFGAGFLIGRSQ